MRTHWRTVLGISLAVAVVTEIVVVLLQGLYLDNTAVLDDPGATPEETLRAAGGSLLNSSVVLLVTAVAAIAATALLTPVMSRSVLGRPVTAGEVARDIRPQLPRLCGLTLLLPLIGAAIIGVGTLPGILVALGGSTAEAPHWPRSAGWPRASWPPGSSYGSPSPRPRWHWRSRASARPSAAPRSW